MAEQRSLTGRREPPPFRRVNVVRTNWLGPKMVRVTLGGEALRGLTVGEPAASIRLLLPDPGEELVIPSWNGNEFLKEDGGRPIIRTFTPRRLEPSGPELDLDMVIHSEGAASAWATKAAPGAEAAVSGPGRGYVIDRDVSDFVLVGDESAVPAISQLIEAIDPAAQIRVHLEVDDEFGSVDLPEHPGHQVTWHHLGGEGRGYYMTEALAAEPISEDTAIWCAGQAAAMQQIRNHLFKDRGIPRSQATVRGYWK